MGAVSISLPHDLPVHEPQGSSISRAQSYEPSFKHHALSLPVADKARAAHTRQSRRILLDNDNGTVFSTKSPDSSKRSALDKRTSSSTELIGSSQCSELATWLLHRIGESIRRGEVRPNLYSVTLTLPPGTGMKRARREAASFCRDIGRQGADCGAWLVLDAGQSAHLHWHGLVFSGRSQAALISRWARQTDAVKVAQKLKQLPDAGQESSQEIGRWIAYVCKPLPESMPAIPLRKRMVASGELGAFRERVLRRVGKPDPSGRKRRRIERACERCGTPHQRGANARFCSPSCTNQASQERTQLLKSLPEQERDAVVMRADEEHRRSQVSPTKALDRILREYQRPRYCANRLCGNEIPPEKRRGTLFCHPTCGNAHRRRERADS